MTESISRRLCHENCVTNRTMLTFCKTCVHTIGSNCLVGDLGMTESINRRLCHENCVTNRAVFSLCETGIGACGRYDLVYNFGMRLLGDYFGASA